MFFLALRHLTSRKRQTILTLLGVALGTAAFITFAGIMTGFQDFIVDQLVNNDSHVRISAQDSLLTEKDLNQFFYKDQAHVFWKTLPIGHDTTAKIYYPTGWSERFKKDPRVYAYSLQLTSAVMFNRGAAVFGGRITGMIPSDQSRVTNIESYMQSGTFKSLANGGRKVVVGSGLLKKLGARLNDSIMISTGKFEALPFKITGVFSIGVTALDDTMAFMHLNDAQTVTHRPGEVSDIALRLTDVDLSQEFADFYEGKTQDKVQSWKEANSNILSVFSLQNFIRNFITISIMVVASFGIYNILNILVNQKRKDIGILRSMGFDSNEVLNLFLIQGMLLGVLGGVLGLFFGFLMTSYMAQMKIGGMMNKMIINSSPQLYMIGLGMALVSSLISSYLPARSAGKLRPIDIVRSGE